MAYVFYWFPVISNSSLYKEKERCTVAKKASLKKNNKKKILLCETYSVHKLKINFAVIWVKKFYDFKGKCRFWSVMVLCSMKYKYLYLINSHKFKYLIKKSYLTVMSFWLAIVINEKTFPENRQNYYIKSNQPRFHSLKRVNYKQPSASIL